MRAMIFAAGLGTRLRPLTNDRPKALVEVNGIPLLEIVIRRLITAGCKSILINVHHFADKVEAFLKDKQYFNIDITVSDERDLLLDTGGGLKKAADFFKDGKPFIVHNTDIISNIDLLKLYQHHCQSDAIATLASRNRSTSRYLLYDKNKLNLMGWKNEKTALYKWSRYIVPDAIPYAFSGIYVLDPEIFKYMHKDKQVFSIIDVFLAAAKTKMIYAYPHDKDIWLDAGKPAQIEAAAKLLDQVL